jgi:hypothetical protein
MRRRLIAYTLLLWYLPACTAWHVVEGVSPEHLIATRHPDVVRVTRPDSSHMVLYEPRVAGDRLSGVHYTMLTARDLSVIVSDIKQIEIRKISGNRTTWLLVGIVVVPIVAAIALLSSVEIPTCFLACGE